MIHLRYHYYNYRSLLFVLAAVNLLTADKGAVAGVKHDVAVGSSTYADIGSEHTIPCASCQLLDGSYCLGYNSTDADAVVTQWYRGGLPLETTAGKFRTGAKGSLVISVFGLADVGNYYCKRTYSSSGSLVSIATNLRASDYNLAILFETTSIAAPRGDSLRVVCPVQQWVPKPPVTWYKNSEAITSLDQRLDALPGGVLHITDLDANTSGIYHCEAETLNGTIITSQNNLAITIDELGEREFKVLAAPPAGVRYAAADDNIIELFINPVDGAQVRWYLKVLIGERTFGWQLVPTSKPNQYVRGLQVAGEYRAEIVSSTSSTSSTTSQATSTVTIGSPPKYDPSNPNPFTEWTSYIAVIATLKCDMVGVPRPSTTWYKNGEPVQLCHEKKLESNGDLTLEKISLLDAGYYQCVASNEYGSKSRAYNLKVLGKEGAPHVPVITSATFISPDFIEVYWRARNQPADKTTFAFSITYSEKRCTPDALSLYKVFTYAETQCRPCLGSAPAAEEECCQHTVETPDHSVDYKVQLSVFNRWGGQSSAIIDAKAYSEVPQPSVQLVKLGIQLLDFGNALLFQWQRVATAASYRVTLIYRSTDGVTPIVSSELIERSNDQNYTLIEGFSRNVSLFLEVEAVQEPVTHVDNIRINLTNSALVTKKALAPSVHTVGIEDDDGTPGVIAYWSEVKNCSYYYVWYRCDGREALVQLNVSYKSLTISNVEKRCLVVVAPLVNGSPQAAGIAKYDKWCTEIVAPGDLIVTPHKDAGGGSTKGLYGVFVEWSAAHPANITCEVNYLIQWRNPAVQGFSEQDSIIVRDDLHTLVKNLSLDVTYEFKVTAFTNVSDVTQPSPILSHTVGPPHSARNLTVDLYYFPTSTEVSWSPAVSGHAITLYVVRLYRKLGYRRWELLNTSTIEVKGVFTHYTVMYNDLSYSTTYNMTITGINLQGPGRNTAVVFSTPASTSAQTTGNTGLGDLPKKTRVVLTETHVGIIIGVSISVVLMFISALMCLAFKRRYTKSHSRRRSRGRSGRLQCAYDQQPLTVCTLPSQFEMSTSVGGASTSTPPYLVNNNITPSLPLCQSFVSPPQLSLKATSGQDSGIDGTTEDHRSSQDLGEYDVETEALMDSSLSLSSELSVNNPRWSCEPATLPLRAARIHTESESDSLLTDSHKHSKHSVSCRSQLETSAYPSQSNKPSHSGYEDGLGLGLGLSSSMDNLSSSCTLRASDGSTIGS